MSGRNVIQRWRGYPIVGLVVAIVLMLPTAALAATPGTRQAFLDVVLSQPIDDRGGIDRQGENNNMYTRWYGLNDEWCGMFVDYCAREAGIPTSVIPTRIALVRAIKNYYYGTSRWHDYTYHPQPGDLVIYSQTDDAGHVGIVTGIDGSRFYTVEGNRGGSRDVVLRDSWAYETHWTGYGSTMSYIVGFCSPDYDEDVVISDGNPHQWLYGSDSHLEDGLYKIRAVTNNKMLLGVEGDSYSNKANVQVAHDSGTGNQWWWIKRNDDGTYLITEYNSGKALDLEYASTEWGTNISQFDVWSTNCQKWYIEKCGNGVYAIASRESGQYVSVQGQGAYDGCNVWQWPGDTRINSSRWIIVPYWNGDAGPKATPPEGWWYLRSAIDCEYVVDIDHIEMENGANATLCEFNGGKNQQFRFVDNKNGTYQIEARHSGKALEVAGASYENRANIHQWSKDSVEHRSWYVHSCGESNVLAFDVKHSGLFMDVENGVAAGGSNIRQHAGNGSKAQQFVLTPADGGTPIDVGSGEFCVVSAADDSLAVASSGASAKLATHTASSPRQLSFKRNSDGTYYIRDASGKSLSIDGGSYIEGANLVFSNTESRAMKWYAEDAGDGFYKFRNYKTNFYLSLCDVSAGSSLQQLRADDSVTQKFGLVSPTPPEATGIVVSSESKTLISTGATDTLALTFEPTGAGAVPVTWSSSDETVVTVSQQGVLTAVCNGTARVMVESEDGALSATCTITVQDAPHVPSEAIEVDRCEASCSEAGSYVSVVYCNRCGNELSRETVELQKLAHSPGTPVEEHRTNPTCTVPGSYDTVAYCTVCGEEVSRETTPLPKLEHTWDEGVVTTEPTCTEDGIRTFGCSACNAQKTEKIDKTGHTPTQPVIENESAANNCVEGGSYDEVVYCGICHEELSRTHKTQPAGEHAVMVDPAVVPTCTEEGLTEGSHCGVCGTVLMAQQRIEPTGHIEQQTAAVVPTCIEPGSMAGKRCKTCGEVLSGCETIAAFGHDYQIAVVEPTCTQAGYTEHKCSRCEDAFVTDRVAAKPHMAGEPVTVSEVPATCEALGSQVLMTTCAVCHKELYSTTEVIPAKGHRAGEPAESSVTAAMCETAGHRVLVVRCQDCEKELDRTIETIPASGHAWSEGDVIDYPTCTVNGQLLRTCEICGATKTEDVVATGHIPGREMRMDEVTSTCRAAGHYDVVTRCISCNTELSRSTMPLPLAEHVWGDWVTVLEATYEHEGLKLRNCDICKLAETQQIPRKPEPEKVSLENATIADIEARVYSGKAIKPKPTITLGGKVLVENQDYTLAYKNNTKPGVASITATGVGLYEGETTVTFAIYEVWTRLWGQNALDTMRAIAGEFGRTSVAVVTTNADFKDALAASCLAGQNGALVLTTPKGSVASQTKSALKEAGVKTVYVVGSAAEVSDATMAALKSGTGVTKVERVGGSSASARAIAAAKKCGKRSDTVIIATQGSFKDALSIAPYSYATKSPILYAETNKSLSAATLNYIRSAGYKYAVIVGGPVALPASVDTQLANSGGIRSANITRLAGGNSYDTSLLIAQWATGAKGNGNNGTYNGKPLAYVRFQPGLYLGAEGLAVATSQSWKDALCGAALCGRNGSVLLLGDETNSARALEFTGGDAAGVSSAYVLGGPVAVSARVWDALVASTAGE